MLKFENNDQITNLSSIEWRLRDVIFERYHRHCDAVGLIVTSLPSPLSRNLSTTTTPTPTRRIDRKLTQPERRSPHEVNMGENIFDIKINKLTFPLFLSCSLCVLSLCTSLSLNWKLCLYLSLNLCLSVSFYYYTFYLSLLFFCYLPRLLSIHSSRF